MNFTIDTRPCRRRVLDLYGDDGQRWLDQLPGQVAEFAQRWSVVRVLPPYPNESYSYVAPVLRADGSSAVLKIGVPSLELRCQVDILRLCAGQGMVGLLEADRAQGALLMEQI